MHIIANVNGTQTSIYFNICIEAVEWNHLIFSQAHSQMTIPHMSGIVHHIEIFIEILIICIKFEILSLENISLENIKYNIIILTFNIF